MCIRDSGLLTRKQIDDMDTYRWRDGLYCFKNLSFDDVLKQFEIYYDCLLYTSAFCVSLTCLTYVLVYGKVLDWYDDESIRWATAVSILFAGIFLYMDAVSYTHLYNSLFC